MTSKNCPHRWLVATPNGESTSRGICRRCGATRDFPNAFADVIQEVTPAGLAGKPAGRLVS